MAHYLLELALWLMLAYFIGCLLGSFLRSVIAPDAVYSFVPPEPVEEPAEAAPLPVAQPAAASPLAAAAQPARPAGIAAARTGGPDDLQRISGVGPAIERTLHGLGFYRFDQIAGWTDSEVAWVSEHLNFPGRIEREEWVAQARLLAAGDEVTFARLYGTGGLKDGSGESRSGTRTRRTGRQEPT
jgi:predicted flap endonuclease-1-like 5' DNA nuclease